MIRCIAVFTCVAILAVAPLWKETHFGALAYRGITILHIRDNLTRASGCFCPNTSVCARLLVLESGV